MSSTKHFDHRPAYVAGSRVLQKIGWKPNPGEMFNAPSRAKHSRLHSAASLAHAFGESVDLLLDQALLAARIQHFIAIGGKAAEEYFLGDHCRLDAQKIARLSRRMPPFIMAKLQDLYAGSANIDSNHTGAFDTNGWSELRVRLPKFASMLQHYAAQPMKADAAVRERIEPLLAQIEAECDQLLKKFAAQGDGKERRVPQPLPRALEWSKAPMRLAQALGVLRKCNRDLASPHWRPEWVATNTDLSVVCDVVTRMKVAARTIAASPSQ